MLHKGSEGPDAWFRRAEDDLVAARLLLIHDGPLSVGALLDEADAMVATLKGLAGI